MPSENVLTFNVEIKRRPMMSRLLISPKVFLSHYKLLRKTNSVWTSMRAALALTSIMFRVEKGKWRWLFD